MDSRIEQDIFSFRKSMLGNLQYTELDLFPALKGQPGKSGLLKSPGRPFAGPILFMSGHCQTPLFETDQILDKLGKILHPRNSPSGEKYFLSLRVAHLKLKSSPGRVFFRLLSSSWTKFQVDSGNFRSKFAESKFFPSRSTVWSILHEQNRKPAWFGRNSGLEWTTWRVQISRFPGYSFLGR